jgi:lysophospholipase L1-like esterase
MTWRGLLVVAAVGAALALAALLGRTAWRLQQAAGLARQSEPLQHRPGNATLRLLIVGDSTAVGTGATAPENSLAGLIAARFPRTWIVNRARDGATWADLPRQLAGDERFDLVLVQAGGNDVIRLRDMADVQADIQQVTARALQRADTVVLMPAGNVGNAQLLFPPLTWWMTQRARQLHAAIAAVSQTQGVRYVNLFKTPADDPFVQRPALHAVDGLHPSDAGYRVWFDELLNQTGLGEPGGLLARAAVAAP